MTTEAPRDDGHLQQDLQSQRLDAYMAEPWQEGNRIAAAPYQTEPTYPSYVPFTRTPYQDTMSIHCVSINVGFEHAADHGLLQAIPGHKLVTVRQY